MPLFIVRTEIESVVVADDEDHACEVAAEWKNDIADEADLYSWVAWDAQEIKSVKQLPQGWSVDSLPWGSDDDVPVKEYLVPKVEPNKNQLALEGI